MTRRIYKYPITGIDVEINIPALGQICTCLLQEGVPTLWVDVEDVNMTFARRFVVVGTGHEVPSGAIYTGTWQEPSSFVGHLFEVPL